MLTPDHLDKTINETIKAAAQEQWPMFREGIQELAGYWRTMAQQTGELSESRDSFVELCWHIENTAVQITDDQFLRTKIKAELKDATKPKIIH